MIVLQKLLSIGVEVEREGENVIFKFEHGGVKVRIEASEEEVREFIEQVDYILASGNDPVCGQCGHVVYPVSDGQGGVLPNAYLCPSCSVGVRGQ